MSDYTDLYNAILTGNAKKAEEVTKAALAAKVDPTELVRKYMIPAMDEVGKRFECNEYFVPELLIAARAMKTSLELITPLLAEVTCALARPLASKSSPATAAGLRISKTKAWTRAFWPCTRGFLSMRSPQMPLLSNIRFLTFSTKTTRLNCP